MLTVLRSFIRLSWMGLIAVLPVFAAAALFAQSAASPGTPATPAATQAPASQASPAPCPLSPNADIPLSATIHATVTGTLDSARLKVGKEIWVNVAADVTYPGCMLNAGTALYAHVMSAATAQGSNPSELSLSFDHADCLGRNKKEMPLRLIALLGPSENVLRVHEELPIMMRGSSRKISVAVKAEGTGTDKFNLDAPPPTVQLGAVMGIPNVKLEIKGGPGCSSRITSTDRSVQLTREMELIFLVESH
jgi:hypothetical protein